MLKTKIHVHFVFLITKEFVEICMIIKKKIKHKNIQ